MLKKLRVHISPVGFDIDRVVIPLEELNADKVWLISEKDEKTDEAQPYIDEIRKKLKTKRILNKTKKCSIRNLFDVLHIYKEIIDEEQKEGHEIFFNVSTGSKIEAIAGMMACMMFRTDKLNINAYYVVPKVYSTRPKKGKRKKIEGLSRGCKEIIELPHYRIEKPSNKLINALRIIDKYEDGISKKLLIKAAKEEKLFIIKEDAKSIAASEHSAINKGIIEPLEEWGFVERKGKGKRGKIIITKDGKNALYFLNNKKS